LDNLAFRKILASGGASLEGVNRLYQTIPAVIDALDNFACAHLSALIARSPPKHRAGTMIAVRSWPHVLSLHCKDGNSPAKDSPGSLAAERPLREGSVGIHGSSRSSGLCPLWTFRV
jgi:hypothetical protein